MNRIWKQAFGNSKVIEIPLDNDEFVLSETHFSYTRRGISIILLAALMFSVLFWYGVLYFCLPKFLHFQSLSRNDMVQVVGLFVVIASYTVSECMLLIKNRSCLALSNKRLFLHLYPSYSVYPTGIELIAGCERTKVFGFLNGVKIKLSKSNWAITLWERTHLTEIEAHVNQFVDVTAHTDSVGSDSRRILRFERLTFMKHVFESFKWLALGVIILSIFAYVIR
jgi:hypothetical protein